MEKFTEKFKNFLSSDESLKRIPKYLFALCILFVAILVTLIKINNNLEILANDNEIEVIKNQDEYNSVLGVYEEKESQIGDYIPYYNEQTTNSKSTENDTTVSSNSNDTNNNYLDVESSESSAGNSSMKITYVINTNSNKIHLSDCSFADRIKDENKKTVQLSKEELTDYLNNGYSLCKTCGGD